MMVQGRVLKEKFGTLPFALLLILLTTREWRGYEK